jgi:hypothetical protein
MKKTLQIIILLFFVNVLHQNAFSQQESLFNSEGVAVAFIDYQDNLTIYLWDGTAVAFIKNDGCNFCVFGLNGNFIGWYNQGIIYDRQGYPMAVKRDVVMMQLQKEPEKMTKKPIPDIKDMKFNFPSLVPEYKDSWSYLNFKITLLTGVEYAKNN